jgi:hypothetical protein
MTPRHAIAPSYARLRPLRAPTGASFPVYPDLVDRLRAAPAAPDPTAAHVLGTCAGYAYSDADTVAMIAARLGLEDARCLEVAQAVDAMFIASTAFLLQSRCGRVVILCYRGTEPASFVNWLTDADVSPEPAPFRFAPGAPPFLVHGGFYRNVRATRYLVIEALQRALAGRAVSPELPDPPHALEALYVTGHSLGAAMAALLGVMLATDPAYGPIAARLRAVYTYGQPMIGEPALAAACQAHPFLGTRVLRYVYGRDVVPALPPTASGRFAHFGREFRFEPGKDAPGRFTESAEPTGQIRNLLEIPLAVASFVAHQLRYFRTVPFVRSLADHGPQHYIAALTPPGVGTEFGGD